MSKNDIVLGVLGGIAILGAVLILLFSITDIADTLIQNYEAQKHN